MQTVRREFNQENFTLSLEEYFHLVKYQLKQSIFSSCLMIFFSLVIAIPAFWIEAVNNNDSSVNWTIFLILGYIGLFFLFISLSFLTWNSLHFVRLKKMTKKCAQKKEKNRFHQHQKDIYFSSFEWIAKIYFSKKSIQDSLVKMNNAMVADQNWKDKNQIVSEINPIVDELEDFFPWLSIIVELLIVIFLLLPMLRTQINYSKGFHQIDDTELVRTNFSTIADKFTQFLFDN